MFWVYRDKVAVKNAHRNFGIVFAWRVAISMDYTELTVIPTNARILPVSVPDVGSCNLYLQKMSLVD